MYDGIWGDLYVGGQFNTFLDSAFFSLVKISSNGVVSQIGPFNSTSDFVDAMIIYQGKLIIAGQEGDEAIWSWDGTVWDTLAYPFDRDVNALEVFNGELYAAGDFEELGGDSLLHIAKLSGGTWNQVGNTALDGDVRALEAHDGQLFIGGEFEFVGTDSVNHVAVLNGNTWEQLSLGLDGTVNDMLTTPNGLIIVGGFDETADNSMQLFNSTLWDGTSFVQSGFFQEESTGGSFEFFALNIPGYGPAISSGSVTVINPDSYNRSVIKATIRESAEFNGNVLIGKFANTYDSYIEVDGLGKILPGKDGHQIAVAGMNVLIEALGDFVEPQFDGPGFEVPAGSGRSSLFYTSLWAVANNANGLSITRTAYPDPFGNFNIGLLRAGPTANNLDLTYSDRYHEVWKLDNGLVWDHISNWGNPGYVLDRNLAAYPANGNTSNGERLNLAPFEDLNGDGMYQPGQGEFPVFKGDVSTYTVKSDSKSATQPNDNPVGLDVISQNYAFDVPQGDPLYQVMFTENNVINRSGVVYDSLWISFFIDFDIGAPLDDYAGSDSTLNMVFGYNGDNDDQNEVGVLGYGAVPPAQGMVLLNHELSSAVLTDGIFSVDSNLYNNVRGRLADGSPMNSPLSGATQFIFHGDPNDPSAWSEVSAANAPDDRRMFASVGPFLNVQPNQELCFEVAHIYARDSTTSNLSNVALLKQRASAVQSWYDQNTLGCGQYIALSVHEEQPEYDQFKLYPNPALQLTTLLRTGSGEGNILVRNIDGRVLQRYALKPHVRSIDVDVSSFSAGTYLITLYENSVTTTQRLIVE